MIDDSVQIKMMHTAIDPYALPEPFKTRVITFRDTVRLCESVPASHIRTYKYAFLPGWHPSPRFNHTAVSVVPLDTFVAVTRIAGGGKVACLNFADDGFPTGCASTGSGAQEESLCYRSTLSKHLNISHYPLQKDVLLYSPAVFVFKAQEEEGFHVLATPFMVDVISCPGVRHPRLTTDGGRMGETDALVLRIKIETILQVAYREDVHHLVLGALGCGAWRNPPEDVAAAFKEVLDRFPNLFQSIVFAIKPTPSRCPSTNTNSSSGSFEIFHTCLSASTRALVT